MSWRALECELVDLLGAQATFLVRDEGQEGTGDWYIGHHDLNGRVHLGINISEIARELDQRGITRKAKADNAPLGVLALREPIS